MLKILQTQNASFVDGPSEAADAQSVAVAAALLLVRGRQRGIGRIGKRIRCGRNGQRWQRAAQIDERHAEQQAPRQLQGVRQATHFAQHAHT